MLPTFSSPDRPIPEIIATLAEVGIANLRPDDLAKPTVDVAVAVYSNFIAYVDPLGDDPDGQIGFKALELLDNPDHCVDAIRVINVYKKVKDALAAIQFTNFTLTDLLKPEPKRTVHILSAIVNFLYYREEKLIMLQPIVDQCPDYEEKRVELEARIEELNKEIVEWEMAREEEKPMVQELDAEVKRLKQMLQSYNKMQMSLKTESKVLKEKMEAVNDKITQADFDLVEVAKENTKWRSKIVQSPDKLQRILEEKKATRNEVKNSEKSAMQNVQKKTATLEVYSKAYDKMSKQFSQMQAIQEQVNSVKGVERQIKAYKAKLSEEALSNITLDAKIDEWQGKAKQAEELVKAMKNERDSRHEQESQQLDSLRTELEGKLRHLERREKEVEAVVAKGDRLCSEALSIREAGKLKQQELHSKLEAIVDAFDNYSSMIDVTLQSVGDQCSKPFKQVIKRTTSQHVLWSSNGKEEAVYGG